jgi:catechol 2,3-dioxygenase-like lactoylglutathione lyase family enzyme
MGTVTIAPRSRSRELSVAVGKPMLRGIHHLALVTDDMRMTLDFYVRVLGMPIVHGLRTPSRPPGASHAHGNGAPPYANIPHYFTFLIWAALMWAATVCSLSLNIRKELPRLTATRSVRCNMFHSPVALHGIGRYWSD